MWLIILCFLAGTSFVPCILKEGGEQLQRERESDGERERERGGERDKERERESA